jgi:TM2 domain-containing membrane protein YozV
MLPATPGYVVSTSQPGLMVVAPKNPAISLIVSFFIPGVGSMINGDSGIGVAILLLWLAGLGLSVFLIGVPLAIGAWIWGMIDAYQGAQRWNARHGIIS